MKLKQLMLLTGTVLLSTFSLFAQDEEQSGRNSVIKFSPSKLMRGEILFSYERKMAEQASFELSVGPAISNVSPIDFDHLFGNGTNATESSLMGFTATLGARYYPLEDKDALEGFYIAPIFGFTNLNYLYSGNNVIESKNLPDKRGSSKQSSFAFVFGTQKWLSKSFSLDMYVGSGLRQSNIESYFIDYSTDQLGNTTASWQTNNSTDVQWFITGGIKVGIGFGKKK